MLDHSCLGIEALGHCAYDPADPGNSYFGIGEAAAALAFTLAVPQFIRPIYRMRLAARRIRVFHIFALAFGGAAFALIGALLPHWPVARTHPLAWPVVWEILGGLQFAVAYALLAFGSVLPLTAKAGGVRSFAQAVAHFLTTAEPADHVEFAEAELAGNFVRLTTFANFLDRFETPSAFHDFTYRREIEDGIYAGSLLRIASDQHLCQTLVDRTPWLAAELVRLLETHRIRCRAAERFVQEIARQAILSDNSLLEREAGFGGFSTAPVLAEALFSNPFVAVEYRPLQWLGIGSDVPLTRSFIRRFNLAAERLLSVDLEAHEYMRPQAHYDVANLYKRLFQNMSWLQTPPETAVLVELTSGAKGLFTKIRSALNDSANEERKFLYRTSDCLSWGENLVEVYAHLAFELLETIANDFKGVDDPYWSFAIGLWHDIFPFHQSAPEGLDPFQQRLIIHLMGKVNDNMDGWYPAITRVMLSVQGPHNRPPPQYLRSAYAILGDLFYERLRTGLPALAAAKPEKIADQIPPTVTYDAEANILTRRYTGGTEHSTDLNALQVEAVDLFDPDLRLVADRGD